MPNRQRVLFVCTGNAGRSQMAQAMFRDITVDQFEILSAGVEPWENLHPLAQKLMQDAGLDFSGQYPKHVNNFADEEIDLVVTIGNRAHAESPEFPSCTRQVFWDIDDPADADGTTESEAVFRRTKQLIADRLPDLQQLLQRTVNTSDIAWKPAISTLIVRPEAFEPSTHLPMLVKAGFEVIELCCFFERADHFAWEDPSAIRELIKIADGSGVRIWSMHPPDRDYLSSQNPENRTIMLDVVRRTVDMASELGASVVPIHTFLRVGTDDSTADARKRLQCSLEELAQYARGTPITLGLETLRERPTDSPGKQIIDWAKAGGQSAFSVVLDTGHSHLAGDLPELPQQAGRFLNNLHIHDNDRTSDQHLLPGNGTIDWAAFVADLCQAQYRGPLLLEVSCTELGLEPTLKQCQEAVDHLLSLKRE